jgi:uncharacterized protein YjbI with pentapeptide repeats/uncharacterized protein with HEPN domain
VRMFNRRRGGLPAMWPWIRAGAHLGGKDLRGARLRRARLSGANLRLARMSYADLTKADLSGAKLDGAKLFEARLQGVDLRRATLTGTYLKGADLTDAQLGNADLAGADLSGTRLAGAELRGANFERANLIKADLHGQDLRGVHLARAALDGADLSGADLSGADLSGATLAYTNLRGVPLQGADLSRTDLSKTLLNDVDQSLDADFQLISVRWSSSTRWPSLSIAEKIRECSEQTEPGVWHVVRDGGRSDGRQSDLLPNDSQQDLPHLVTIVKAARQIAGWTSRTWMDLGYRVTWENVEDDRVAVHGQLEIIAEAVAGLSKEVRDKLPDTAWRGSIYNVRRHQVAGNAFFPHQWSAVRQAATVDIPDLGQKVMALLRADFPDAADALADGSSGEETPSGE